MARILSLPILYVLHLLLLVCFARAYTTLKEESLRLLPDPSDDFDIHSGAILSPILRPRVPGSANSTYVLNHFIDFFKTNLPKWDVSLQNSTSKTPATGDKDVPFVNMIVSRDPPWTKPGEVGRLTLVAHYDSKFHPTGFVGATDSAAPCAMIMHAARAVDNALTKKWEGIQAEGVGPDDFAGFGEHQGIQILFLDGEEAFVSWTNDDSLYGARSLAAEWESTLHPALSTYHTPLSAISLFLLLDLLGSKDPQVPSYFKTTHWAYQNMADLENRLRSFSLLNTSSNRRSQGPENDLSEKPRAGIAFLPDSNKDENLWRGGQIEDDHVPFMARGVEVLHIIPTPFPRVWHEMDDDGEHLDMATVRDWAMIVTAFVGEWMNLEGFFEPVSIQAGKTRSRRTEFN